MGGDTRFLTGLRGAAALLVLLAHASEQGLIPDLFRASGRVGVALFFILSGHLTAALYLRRDFHAHWRGYLAARIARIAPLFLLVLVSGWLFTTFDVTPWRFDITDAMLVVGITFLYLPQTVLWTIPVEVQFYLLFLLVWAATARFGGRIAARAMWGAAGLMWLCALIASERWGLRALFLPFWAPFFAIGLTLGAAPEARVARWREWYLARRRWAGPVAAALAVMVLPWMQHHLGFGSTDTWRNPWIVPGLLAACALGAFDPWVRGVLNGSAAQRLGEISYSLYLLHSIPLLYAVNASWATGPAGKAGAALTALGGGVALAVLSFRYIEDPARRALRRRWGLGPPHGARAAQGDRQAG